MIKQEALALLTQERKGNIARREAAAEALESKLFLVDVFAEIRAATGQMFRGETFYGPSVHEES
jgi:hypothetical protein